MAGQYQYLFTPIRIGTTIIPNRIVFAAHLTNLAEENMPGSRLIAYYAERARGGCGLIITEEQSVHLSDWAYQPLIHGFDPHVIPCYRRMTRAVHEHGTRMFAQINHNGMQASSIYSRRPVLGPSPLVDPIHREICKELEPEEISEIVRGYALVARHVREGGFDGAELQSSHSSLIRQFFSPYYNRRTDAYGGSLENRMRFALEVTAAVRAEIGRDFTLGIRLCGDELIPAGLTLDDVCEISRRLETTGQLDFINTSIGEFHNLYLVGVSVRRSNSPSFAQAASKTRYRPSAFYGMGWPIWWMSCAAKSATPSLHAKHEKGAANLFACVSPATSTALDAWAST